MFCRERVGFDGCIFYVFFRGSVYEIEKGKMRMRQNKLMFFDCPSYYAIAFGPPIQWVWFGLCKIEMPLVCCKKKCTS